MLEKNKDYIEMRVSSTDCAFTQNAATTISIEGFSYNTSFRLPDPGESYVIISKEKFEQLQTENEELKKKLSEFDFMGWMESAKLWKGRYNDFSKLVGFSSEQEIEDYLVNEAECDTLSEAVSKLKDQVKYTCDEWCSANSSNNSWKAAAECNSPKELIEKREALEKEIEVYSRTLKEWKEITGCPSPSAAKTLIENGPTHIIYLNDPLGVIAKWEKVTGYDRPEDFLKWKANIEGIMEAWKDRTGCKYPGEAEKRIKALNERIDESEACYNHLLALTGFESEGEIEDALDKCDHSTLRKALVDYEFDYETLLKLTGYKSEQDIRVALNYSEQFVYETMRELINSLKNNAKFTESNWQHATGCNTPGMAEEKLEFYKERLGKAVQAASCAAKHLENITF